MRYEIQQYQRKIMWQKIFVFKEYIQRHVLRAVKYLKKSSGEYYLLIYKNVFLYIISDHIIKS